VKEKAILQLRGMRNISVGDATAVVERVFERCYNDTEPFGRQVRQGPDQEAQALRDGIFFGYLPYEGEVNNK